MNTSSIDVRPQAVAGMFYPGDAGTLRETVRQLLDDAKASAAAQGAHWPKAIVVPHAGYIYSGSTAAKAFAQLAPARGKVRRVVLLGPVHRVPVRGLALPGAMAFQTPLGNVPLDLDAVRSLGSLRQVTVSARVHAMEHSLEVQLPFLQQVLGDFKLLPLAVGDATPQEVAEVLEAVWGGEETLIVISSDLSHYHPYDDARAIDRETVETMLRGEPVLDHEQACGATPVNGLLLTAAKHGLKPRLVALCNSGDTAGPKDQVVGYASLAFDERAVTRAFETQASVNDEVKVSEMEAAAGTAGTATGDGFPADAGRTLLALARASIASALGGAAPSVPDAEWLKKPAATFVTLTQHDDLRGCIGTLEAHRPLADDVISNARSAAFRDPRFAPLTARELANVTVEVSVLTAAEPMTFSSEEDLLQQLRPGVDGLILEHGHHRGTFLPQVWEQLPQPKQFLAHLKQKAGLPAAFWDSRVRVSRYTVRKWSEAEEGARR